ncbi:restriction endonuclease subunit S [Tenacibaculum finnmarkense]|uniref:restriction endonuclease subunit S n=1 Tax=Tenacibaculum finnmarkense TaxID=2781243 RepID=UPI001E30A76E|nr:restriction endonuclease subunit S [Tenacibaculum finnmarkense]MCD8400217.1 restriction endonuclease subunit S [Tenacibaculum finnmarkense genomovar ulcerans]
MIKFDESRFIKTTLGELVSKEKKSIISGPFGSNVGKRFFQEEGIPLIRGNNLSKGQEKFKDEGFVFLTKEKANELNCYAIKNDLIFTAVGTIGQVGIIDEKLKFEEYVISNKQLRARFDESIITPLFAYYWFSSYWVQKLILQRNVGSTVPLINLSVLKGLPITLPKSLKTQNNIVNVLENISSKIAINNKINAALEAMAKTLYDYWFVQFDFPDKNGKPYKSSEGKMIFNEELKREIPVGWESGTILDCAYLLGGGTPKKEISTYWNGEIPFFTPTDTEDNIFCLKTILYTNELGISKSSTKLFDKGTILITARGTVGKINIAGKPMAMNQSCYALKPKTDFSSEFIYFHTNQIVKYLKAKSSGSIFKAIVTNDFKFTPTVVPDSEVVKLYSKKTTSMFETVLNNKKQNQKLSELRDWLLPMLMNGQVRVGEK